jgi:hypothetical protein
MDRANKAIRMAQLFTLQNCEIPPISHPKMCSYCDSPQIGGLTSVSPEKGIRRQTIPAARCPSYFKDHKSPESYGFNALNLLLSSISLRIISPES